jgi:hypothetical protein
MLMKLPRWLEGLFLGAIILLVIGLALLWAQVGTTDSGKSCASVALWAWVGCAMAAHENLAGGLIGGGGALFAAWLVGSVVLEQIQDERKRDKEAKRSTLEWKVNDKEQDVAALKAYSERLNKVDEAFTIRVHEIRSGGTPPKWPNCEALKDLQSLGKLHSILGRNPSGPIASRVQNALAELNALANSAQQSLQLCRRRAPARDFQAEDQLDLLESKIPISLQDAKEAEMQVRAELSSKSDELRRLRAELGLLPARA